MPLTREQKQNIIEDLTDKFNRADSIILIDFNKLSVAKTMEFRRLLKQVGAEYKVSKKTLISRVLKSGNYRGVDLDELKAQIGIIFSYGDPAPVANSILKFSKLNETLKIFGGFLNFNWLEKDKIIVLAKLPSREILLAQTLRAIAVPLSGLAVVLSGNARNLINALNQVKNLKLKN